MERLEKNRREEQVNAKCKEPVEKRYCEEWSDLSACGHAQAGEAISKKHW